MREARGEWRAVVKGVGLCVFAGVYGFFENFTLVPECEDLVFFSGEADVGADGFEGLFSGVRHWAKLAKNGGEGKGGEWVSLYIEGFSEPGHTPNMPYVIAPMIRRDMPGLWGEGPPYSAETIYALGDGPKSPPVNYEAHTFRPHSLCHFDAPSHIVGDGASIGGLFRSNPEIFYGDCFVVKLRGSAFIPNPRDPAVSHWSVSREDLAEGLARVGALGAEKVLLGFDGVEEYFFADPARALSLSEGAVDLLLERGKLNLFGTVWKSADYEPASRERPIHRKLFGAGAGILECLNLSVVPEGKYFLSAFPLPVESASESMVCPVLFKNGI